MSAHNSIKYPLLTPEQKRQLELIVKMAHAAHATEVRR